MQSDFNALAESRPVTEGMVRLRDIQRADLDKLLRRYGLELQLIGAAQPIPGSYWGEEEAGLVGNCVMAREDTPVHSLLHETSHYVCMEDRRRAHLHTDAGGDYDEENAVCYLQILLADQLPGMNRAHMMADMDCWGYTFRLGSARRWFESDAREAQRDLLAWGVIDNQDRPSFSLRRGI